MHVFVLQKTSDFDIRTCLSVFSFNCRSPFVHVNWPYTIHKHYVHHCTLRVHHATYCTAFNSGWKKD